jgi:translation initiation factor IF-3
MAHNEIGRRILTRLASELQEVALIEVPPRQEGMTMVQILGPRKEAAPPKPKAGKAAGAAEPKGAPRSRKPVPAAVGAAEKAESGE